MPICINARIYVTVNTISERRRVARDGGDDSCALSDVGVDALIVQDMGITKLNLPPIPLHASTQMDNRTPEKVKFLWKAGFRQVVLARELSLREIKKIHENCPEVPLEVFVHGALCVSYSGQCYVSQACFGRSANRGECAQFCRLPFSLVDADGKVIVKDKHLLSLKDMNQSDELEAIAGCRSFLVQDRRAAERRFLREECNGRLSSEAGCHLCPSSGICKGFFGYVAISSLSRNWIRVSAVDSHIISCMDVTKRFSLSTLPSRWARRWGL